MSANYTVIIVTYNRKALLDECISKIESQSIPANHVVIVDNASNDGTDIYLDKLSKENIKYSILTCSENIGGAGGFAKGIEYALQWNDQYVLIIDDDAMLDNDYMEKILSEKQLNPSYKAFAGSVYAHGKIDTYHRKMLSKFGMLMKNCLEEMYDKDTFECDIASFCGMVVDTDIVRQIGLPHADYFIWHDDTEYSLRIKKISPFLVVPSAKLNHKTKQVEAVYPRRYEWRDYYAVRNRILYVKEHGNYMDRLVNSIHLFANIVFRNWLFGLIRKDNYDWKYEKELVSKAIRDAGKK